MKDIDGLRLLHLLSWVGMGAMAGIGSALFDAALYLAALPPLVAAVIFWFSVVSTWREMERKADFWETL